MLYKFKSAAGGDVIMLEATGGQVLEIIGKTRDSKGILLPEHMPAAKAAIEAAITQEELSDETADAPADPAHKRISLRTRAWPFVILIERSAREKTPITWGV